MTNFRLENPDAVILHICKTGGTSIRLGIWGGKQEKAFGVIPDEWQPLFKFAFVRHPLDRLVSAWKMFSVGVYNSKVKFSKAPMPDSDSYDGPNVTRYKDSLGMSLRQFLEIAMDETIDFTRPDPAEHVRIKIRRHASPLTHPWNCLDKADFIGRFENFEQDFRKIGRTLGITKKLPHLHRTVRGEWKEHIDAEERELATRFYKEDFEKFSY